MDIAKVRRMLAVASHYSQDELASRFGYKNKEIFRSRVSQLRKQLGIPTSYKRVTSKQKEAIRRLTTDGYGTRATARLVGVSFDTVIRYRD